MTTDEPRIAYLTSVYPRASDTFIRVEVEQLRRIGFQVETFSVNRPPAGQLVSPRVSDEAGRTRYLKAAGPLRLLAAAAVTALLTPRRMLGAALLLARTGATGIKARIKQAAYLVEASLLARWLRRSGVRHVHNHIGENSAHVAMLASHLTGIPYSLTIHGPGIFFAPRHWALGEKIARTAFTACIGHYCASQCMIFAPPHAWDRLHVVRCCVDPLFLEPNGTAVPGKPRLLCVGRLAAEKGQLLLVDAARRLADAGLDFHIDIVGDGELRGAIEQRISACGLEGRITLLGWQSSDQVRAHLKRSRALVVASLAEGLPVVIMESLAMARPVVSTSVAGIPELVEAGVNGWLVPPGSVDDLTDAMRQALTASPQRLAEMGRAGAEVVARQHNVEIEVAKLARLFRRSIDGDVSVSAPITAPGSGPGAAHTAVQRAAQGESG